MKRFCSVDGDLIMTRQLSEVILEVIRDFAPHVAMGDALKIANESEARWYCRRSNSDQAQRQAAFGKQYMDETGEILNSAGAAGSPPAYSAKPAGPNA